MLAATSRQQSTIQIDNRHTEVLGWIYTIVSDTESDAVSSVEKQPCEHTFRRGFCDKNFSAETVRIPLPIPPQKTGVLHDGLFVQIGRGFHTESASISSKIRRQFNALKAQFLLRCEYILRLGSHSCF